MWCWDFQSKHGFDDRERLLALSGRVLQRTDRARIMLVMQPWHKQSKQRIGFSNSMQHLWGGNLFRWGTRQLLPLQSRILQPQCRI